VKVRLAGLTVPSVVSLLEKPMVTAAVGRDDSLTVNVAVPPSSVVFPLIALTVIPAEEVRKSASFQPLGPAENHGEEKC